jgi:HMG-box domain
LLSFYYSLYSYIKNRLTFGELTKQIGAEWGQLSAEDKEEFVQMAAEDKTRYQRELAAEKAAQGDE